MLAGWSGRLSVAAVNGPSATVVSGDADALAELLEWCRSEGVRCRQVPVDYASHSAHVEALESRLLEVLGPIAPSGGEVPFFSTVEGAYVDGRGLDAGYWYRNLRQTVQLESAVRELSTEGYGAFVEVSPHPVLVTAVQETVEAADGTAVVVGSLRRDEGGLERFLTSAAELFVQGFAVDWAAVLSSDRRVGLPTYAFQRERFWLESGTGAGDVGAAGLSATEHPLLGAAVH
ncbi:6-deoxyerythronolide-B synthase, partial [Actinobacteria bacterium OK074]